MAASSDGPVRAPWAEGTPRLRLGDLRIDLRYRRVERPDGHTELPNRMFELLVLFLAEPRVLHTRTALFDRVWSGTVVEDANLSQSVWMLRKALGLKRRHWIRTVPGSGYVFEPPSAVEADAEVATQPDAGAAGAQSPPAAAGTSPATARPRWRHAGALALLACLALGAFAWQQTRSAAASAPPATVTVALIEVGKPAVTGDAGWPVKLLHAWLGWKLDQLPEVVVLSEADLAADTSTLNPIVVLLASGHASGDTGEVFVRARLASDAGTDDFQVELRGTAAQMPGLVDDLSRQLMARLLPARAASPWPELELDADSARDYAKAHAAVNARDWPTVVARAQRVMQGAPGFGLVRLDLAHAQAKLGQTGGAKEQMALARRLLTPLPDDAMPLLDAQELAINPQKAAQAAEAYGALAQEYPDRTRFALEQARLLVQTGQAEQALQILSRPVWDRQPTSIHISRLLGLAQAGLFLGDPDHTLASAREAARLAQTAGSGWEIERGFALMMMAQAELALHRKDAALVMLEQGALQFEQAGSMVNANYMRYQVELARSPDAADSPMLDILLQEARRGGYRNVEIELLRLVAYRHYQAGQHERFRERLGQAFAVANEAGNPFWQHQMDLDLLNEDLLLGDFHSAGQRIARLREAPLQGDRATWVAQFDAYMLQMRGLSGQALAVLDHYAAPGNGEAAAHLPPLTAARMACIRADLLLQQGDLARARAELGRCSAFEHPMTQLRAQLLEAGLLQLTGHAEAAIERLDAVQQNMDALALEGPDRLWILLSQGPLLSRVGEPAGARQMLEEVRTQAEHAGHGWLIALAETGLAEAAAAGGDWQASGQHLAAARKHIPDDAWSLTRRLDLVAVILSLASGERDRAAEALARLDAQAHLFRDVPAVLEVHSLLPADLRLDGCREPDHPALPEEGLDGADLSWLTASLPEPGDSSLVHRDHPAIADR